MPLQEVGDELAGSLLIRAGPLRGYARQQCLAQLTDRGIISILFGDRRLGPRNLVETVGERVKRFSPGDRVFGEVGFTGGLAELATIREDRIARMPANCTFERRLRYRWRASRRSGRSATPVGSGPERRCC